MPEKSTRNYCKIAKDYAKKVVSGKISACSWVIKACRRQLNDLSRKNWHYRFDIQKASRICQFVELMPHIKGNKWGGQKIHLEPWQCFIYTTIFGWVHRDTGLRRFRTVYIECPRKNSKSTMSAPVGVYCLCADEESGAEVYSAATSQKQARAVWEVAWHMVKREKGLRDAFGVNTSAHAIHQTSTASRFEALSAEGHSLDGLNIHCAIIDELHAHRTRLVYDVLETARAARSQPLLWNITTAGSDRSGICYEQRSYVTKILDQVAEDETYFGIIYSIDEDDDWTDPKIWKKANPNYGVSVDPDELRNLAKKAQTMPSAQANFLTKHLSVWVGADMQLFDVAAWDRLGDSSLSIDDFLAEPCWAGVDLAPRHDFTDKVLLFERDGHYYVFATHYLSEGEVEDSDNAQFAGWADQGIIITNPGVVTDWYGLEEDIQEDAKKFDLREVCYDPVHASQVAKHLGDSGLPMVEIPARVLNFSEATKKLDALIAEGKIHHNGDPCLTWMLSNVVGHYDRKNNVFPVKERPENKIDGIMCLIMALSRAMLEMGAGGSIYDSGTEEVWL